MEKERLYEIIANHGRWLRDDGGKRADLSGANLYRAYLCEAELCEAELHGANLERANLIGANLHRANLVGANLEGANLEGTAMPVGVYQIVGPGSCNRCTTYVAVNDQVICGCWDDGAGNKLNSFARRIEEVYGPKGENPNSKYYTEYMAAVNFFRAMKELKS